MCLIQAGFVPSRVKSTQTGTGVAGGSCQEFRNVLLVPFLRSETLSRQGLERERERERETERDRDTERRQAEGERDRD